MITLLVGHRGVGKTTFLNGFETFARSQDLNLPFVDLDRELEKTHGAPVGKLLAQGEDDFREKERLCLAQLIMKLGHSGIIALGAGFEGPIPHGVNVVWLRRSTDAAGRSFLHRPRLDHEMSPLAEYLERFFIRDRRFRDWADEQFFLPEGYVSGLEEFFILGRAHLPFEITLLPEDFRNWKNFMAKRQAWGVRRWEIRDDLLSLEQIAMARQDLPAERILFSRRAVDGESEPGCDWALELGEPPVHAAIISLHQREEDFDSTLRKISAYPGQLKLAVEVKDFTELEAGHNWWKADPLTRSFLPRSTDGRWRWYRSLFGPQMPIHFVREGEGSGFDQPPLWQCLLQPNSSIGFSAVLGEPVEHSRSPLEHVSLKLPFVAIQIPEEEFSVALKFLEGLGLKYAAVTSPLKKSAWAFAHSLSSEARQTQAVNTLYFSAGKIFAHNTDVLALQELRKQLADLNSVWLWGGGGIKSSLKKCWPDLLEISARKGTASDGSPDLVIWATGRQRPFVWPRREIRPKLILDLNYSEDSPGLEWAVRENIPYQSGLVMFKLQADFQRRFWSACETGEIS